MSVYETIRLNRRVIWAGIIVGYSVAAALVVIGIVNIGDDPGAVLGSVALGVAAAVAPTIALISLDRRPALLPAASLAAVMLGVINLTLLLVWLLVVLAWWWAYNRRPTKVVPSRPLWWARVAMAFGVFVAVMALFVHLDPYCTDTTADGTVVEVDPAEKGYVSGWSFGSTTSSEEASAQSGVDGTVSSQCASDTIVWGEAVASLLISLGVVGAALRWPVNATRVAPSTEGLRTT
jgi:hypothetical protein